MKFELFLTKIPIPIFNFSPPPSDSAENLLGKDFRSKTGKIFSTFRILYAHDFFLLKVKRKFFGFGSPASFSKELDAESLGFGFGGKTAAAELFFYSFFCIFSRPCPSHPCAQIWTIHTPY
jgi:hypothetical protein